MEKMKEIPDEALNAGMGLAKEIVDMYQSKYQKLSRTYFDPIVFKTAEHCFYMSVVKTIMANLILPHISRFVEVPLQGAAVIEEVEDLKDKLLEILTDFHKLTRSEVEKESVH